MVRGATLATLLLALLGAAANAQERAAARPERPGELLDCSMEYGVLDTPESYARAFNDVARSYLAAQRLHEERRRDPNVPSEEVDEAWRARVGAAQTLVRACRCWEQLDRVGYPEQVLAAAEMSTRRLKEEVGHWVAEPCAKVFAAEASD
ncbi:MAG: hypothetical protein ACQGVC_07555 [Myxococcota bacterium]